MAESEDGQEKTQDPTERRLQQSIEEGQILTSRELMLGVVLLVGALQFSIAGRWYFGELSGQFRHGLDISDILRRDVPLTAVVGDRFMDAIGPILVFSVPIVVALVAAQAALGGLHFITGNLAFKGQRISPMSGLSRMFGMQAVVELLKSLMKIAFVGALGVAFLVWQLPGILELSSLSFERAMSEAGGIVILTFLVLVGGAAFIAVIDVIYQWRRHMNQLRMTLQEMKDERKESEGSPEVRAKIRQLQREASERGSVANIADAQVLITNPQHFAVGLRYDFEEGTAPTIVTKGSDAVALQLRELAEAKGIPVLSYPLLARALYFTSEIGGEIHAELYRAVAAILSFVYQTAANVEAPEVEVPEALQFDANGRKLEAKNA
jgi:flagellar biosynthetic protein FlhB